MQIGKIAVLCHEANRAICEAAGDMSQKPWDDAEVWQKDSAVKGVSYRINNPNSSPSDQHDAWSEEKYEQGWGYGPEKCAKNKTHPCLVPYEELPFEQRVKDHVFRAIVDAARPMG